MTTLEEQLTKEFEYLSNTFFPPTISSSEKTKIDYIRAVEILLYRKNEKAMEGVSVNIDLIINKNLNIEAIEYVLRRKYPINNLTQRLHILFYLTECLPEAYDLYINETSQFCKGLIHLAYATLRTIVLYIEGTYLLRKHEII